MRIDDDVNGLLIKAGHPEMIEQRVNYLIKYPEEKERIGYNARMKICEEFDAQIGQVKIQELYCELVG